VVTVHATITKGILIFMVCFIHILIRPVNLL
jgi:hypothetical protein